MSERVLRIHTQGERDPSHQIILQNIWNPDIQATVHMPDLTQVVRDCMVEIYTAPEINQLNAALENRLNEKISSIERDDGVGTINKRISAAETKVLNSVTDTIGTLPKQLISTEAQELVERTILRKVQELITDLKSELQSQIDELKSVKE